MLEERCKMARRDRTHAESASPQARRTLASPKGRRTVRNSPSVRHTPVTLRAVCYPSATAQEDSGLPKHTRASSPILGTPSGSPRGSTTSQMFPAPSQLSPSLQPSFSAHSPSPSRHSSLPSIRPNSARRIAPNLNTVTHPVLMSKRQKTNSFEASFLETMGAAIGDGIINRDTILDYLHLLPDTCAFPAVDCSIDRDAIASFD